MSEFEKLKSHTGLGMRLLFSEFRSDGPSRDEEKLKGGGTMSLVPHRNFIHTCAFRLRS